MPQFAFRAKRFAAQWLSTTFQVCRPRVLLGHRIVTFHAIDTHVDGDVNGIYNMAQKTFVRHIHAIKQIGEQQQSFDTVAFGSTLTDSVSITFDDGYLSTLKFAAPLLTRYSLPFHVFVTPSLVQSNDRRYLSIPQLRELSEIPQVTIGAHGYRHIPISQISESDRLNELSAARTWLEDVLQKQIQTMSYPFGSTPANIHHVVSQAGYSTAASSLWGINNSSTNRLMLKRIDLWEGDSNRTLISKLLGYWNWIGRRSSA